MNEKREKLMRLYLLGGLKDVESASLEEEFFADDEKFEQMWEVENRLVDGYVRGRLSAEDREKFERHYLASPVHTQRVAFARNLVEKADSSRAVARATEPKESWISRLAEMMGLAPASWRLALSAAMLLLVAASIWLFVDRARLNDEAAQLRAESEALQSREQSLSDQLAAERGQSERLTKDIEEIRKERNDLEARIASQPERRSILSFVLSPLNVRSGSDPQTLTISGRTDLVRLRMRLPRDDARRFQMDVRTVEGQQVWSQQVNRPRASNTFLTIQIPANRLAMGDYILTLSAVNDKGESAEVSRSFFRVIKNK